MDTFSFMPYTAIDSISMDPKESVPAQATSMMLSDMDEGTIGALLGAVGPEVESPLLAIEVRDYRRQNSYSVPSGPGIQDGLTLFAIGVPMNPEMSAALDSALAGLRTAMAPHAEGRIMLNLLGDGQYGPERTGEAFAAEDFARLRELKRRYDPENRFRFNHNIAP
jgi:hypothetical protein